MRKIAIAFALIAGLFVSQARADFTGKDATPAVITFKNASGACTSVVCVPQSAISDSTGSNIVTVLTAGADATSNTFTGLATNDHLQGFNGTTWDRLQVDGSKQLKVIDGNSAALLTAVQAAIPAGTNRIGYVSDDPCTSKIKTNLPISQNGTSSVQLVALSGATTIYVCAITLVAAGATTVALTTGTGAACVTGNAAVIGTTTANIANSISLAANNGWSQGSGNGTVANGAASSELCMVLGANVFVSGNLTFVQQ